jgi:hypothetical protein
MKSKSYNTWNTFAYFDKDSRISSPLFKDTKLNENSKIITFT